MRRLLFKLASAIHVFVYRLTGGKVSGEIRGFRLLLLTTNGRKTGKTRTIPLGYFEHDGDYVIIASNAGSDHHPAWFRNLSGEPRAIIQVKDRQIEVRAETARGDERSRLWTRLIEVAPGYANYAKQTNREIPLVILRPAR
jgi:deazaflavin-dependent oxidoreductase (nitroreductase family)